MIQPAPVRSDSGDGDSSSAAAPPLAPVPNPKFDDWIAKDHALMTLINATLSPVALAYVVGCATSKEVWDALEKHYSSTSRTNVVNLKTDLQSISKKSSESIDEYIKRIKEIKDRLAYVISTFAF
ncbi:MAG: hypothetical protein Q8835_02540 [Sweet potato little leaf phytoplasma]|nr:hypothetical protein [Sweet potato little leaf phytoplasma]